MRVVISGGAGFIGLRLAKQVLERGSLQDSAGEERDVSKLVLCDVVPSSSTLLEDGRVEFIEGDFGDHALLERLITPDTAVVFHLAAVVSGGAEEDFDLGMQVNLHATLCLLESLRALETCPRVVFASSVAVFGGDLPEVIRDDTHLTPQTSYGGQKAMTEFLLNDYSRRGFLDGRALRLPTIVVRPGKPNKAASSFASSIIREPLQGYDVVCPVEEETGVWVLSPRQVVKSFIHAELLEAEAWGTHRTVSLPGLQTTVKAMVEALRIVAGDQAVNRIAWETDAEVERIVLGWPVRFDTSRANAMGFQADSSVQEIIEAFVVDELDGKIV